MLTRKEMSDNFDFTKEYGEILKERIIVDVIISEKVKKDIGIIAQLLVASKRKDLLPKSAHITNFIHRHGDDWEVEVTCVRRPQKEKEAH